MSKNSRAVIKCLRKKKIDFVESFGGKCQVCGYNKCINALEFHHIEDKKEQPSQVIFRWSKKRAFEELKKCVLLCANCHREAHFKDKDVELKIPISIWIEVKCEQCQGLFQTQRSDSKFCSTTCKQIFERRAERPSREELFELVNRFSFLELGKKFNVSDNAIRKWCRSYGINPKTKSYCSIM